MRLTSYRLDGALRLGLRDGDALRDLTAPLGGLTSMRGLVERGFDGLERLARDGAAFAPDEVEPALPLPDPARILCIGVNYRDRNAEYADGSDAPRYPSIFLRGPASLVAPGAPLIVPRESEQLDYEGEIALVIGRGGRRIPEAEAHGAVAALTLMNEGTIRDWLRHGKFNVTQGKNFDDTGALGPWLETDLAPLDLADLTVETRVNGELRQRDTTASMAFPFARIIAYVSTFTTLAPGDVIATGTPAGAGARFDPPRWLRPGDVVEVSSPALGVLRNPVAAEAG
ncbi:MAG: fumarylacetoacetate hydrolase family protein [Pseudomonadota bacterium]